MHAQDCGKQLNIIINNTLLLREDNTYPVGQEIPTFNQTWMFITLFTNSTSSGPCAETDESTTCTFSFLISILMLSFHQSEGAEGTGAPFKGE